MSDTRLVWMGNCHVLAGTHTTVWSRWIKMPQYWKSMGGMNIRNANAITKANVKTWMMTKPTREQHTVACTQVGAHSHLLLHSESACSVMALYMVCVVHMALYMVFVVHITSDMICTVHYPK